MSNLEKVVLLADYLEPNRNFPGVLRLRQLAQSDLSQAMLHVTETKISYLLENSKVIFPGTLVTRNYYLLESEQSNEDN
jgi:predicted HD superfamily hydrolase involved in NAD metabolism